MFAVLVITILRWACHVRFFMTTSAKGYYNASATLGSFHDSLPHGRVFLHGLAIAGYMSYIVWLWNFIMFVLTGFASVGEHVSILTAVGLVDLVLAVVVLAGVIMESRYLPTSFASCQGATSWRPNDSGESFFKAAKSLSQFEDHPDPETICRSMLGTWALLVAVVAMLFIIAVLNIRVGTREMRIDWTGFVPSKTTMMSYRPKCVEWLRYSFGWDKLRQCISQRRNGLRRLYESIDSEETLVKEEDSKRGLGDEDRIEDKV